jgi:hypothetical protein
MLVISHPMGLQPAIGEVRDPAIGILLNMERAGREVEVDQGHHPQKKAAAALACCLSWPWPRRIRGGPCGPALGGLAQKKVEGAPCMYIYMYLFIHTYIMCILCIYLYIHNVYIPIICWLQATLKWDALWPRSQDSHPFPTGGMKPRRNLRPRSIGITGVSPSNMFCSSNSYEIIFVKSMMVSDNTSGRVRCWNLLRSAPLPGLGLDRKHRGGFAAAAGRDGLDGLVPEFLREKCRFGIWATKMWESINLTIQNSGEGFNCVPKKWGYLWVPGIPHYVMV